MKQCSMLTLTPGSDKDIYLETCEELFGRRLPNKAYDASMPFGVLIGMRRKPRMKSFTAENDGLTDEQELNRSLINHVSCHMKKDNRQMEVVR